MLEAASFRPYPFQENSAWYGHLPFASWLVKTKNPKIFVELGTHWGHSYFSFCQAVKEGHLQTRCYAVDTWKGDDHTNGYGEDVFKHVNTHNQLHYSEFSSLLRMKFDDALGGFKDGSIDLLHIDGFHTYEAVRHDFETWLPKLSPEAIVLFHDTQVRKEDFGVYKFWEELRQLFPDNIEFLHGFGLGVIQVSKGVRKKSSNLISNKQGVS